MSPVVTDVIRYIRGSLSRIPEKRGETRVKSQGVNYPGGKMEVLTRASPSKQQIFASDGVVRVFRSEVTLVGFETSLRFLRVSHSTGLLQEAALCTLGIPRDGES